MSENARLASITASNAIEGVAVESTRAAKIVVAREHQPIDGEGAPRFRNRSYAGGSGGHLKTDQNLIVLYETGSREVVFTPPGPEKTGFLLTELLVRYNELKREGRTHPLVLIATLVIDFLAIHPVADGNGRVARLLTTHELLSQGYGVARYVSIEQRSFESKNTYYDRLYRSQRGWHEGEHDIWPWASYLAQVVAGAYDDFERRVAAAAEPTGSKQERVREYILTHAPPEFRRRDIERALPEISPATVRLVINDLRDRKRIGATGAGPSARWRRL